jgi:hypothetical protein
MKFLFAGREVSPLDTPELVGFVSRCCMYSADEWKLNMNDVDSLVALPQHCLVI